MQLKDIERQTKVVSIQFDKEEVVIEYLPAVVASLEFAQSFANPPINFEPLHALVITWLAKAIVWWDIYDGETPLSVSVESLNRLPVNFIMQIVQAITGTGPSASPTVPVAR